MSSREFRIKFGWSIKDIAKLFNIDEETMLKNESYLYMPNLDILSQIVNMPELEYEV